jgi:hypothetical protein
MISVLDRTSCIVHQRMTSRLLCSFSESAMVNNLQERFSEASVQEAKDRIERRRRKR